MKLTLAVAIALIPLCLLSTSCGGGKSAPPPPQGLHFTAPATAPSIDAGQSVSFTASEPVTWSLQANFGKPVGTFRNQSTTGATYAAPDASIVTVTVQVSVVATSVADPTASAAMDVVINPPVAVSAGTLSTNKNCQYDPINQVGVSNGAVNASYPANGNPPRVSGGTGPYSWSVSSGTLPAGLSLSSAPTTQPPSPSSAFLLGTPVSAGCSQITLQVTDAAGLTATSPVYYLVITPPALKVQVPNYPDAYSGVPYPPTAFTVSGGTPPYQGWNVLAGGDQLPVGMNLSSVANNSAAAVISGTPLGDGLQSFAPSIQVFDSQTPYPAVGNVQLNLFQWPSLPSNACTPAQNGSGGGAVNTANGNMQGSYAFLLRGFDSGGPVVIAGSFSADGVGNIGSGVLDVMRTTGSQAGVAISAGSYAIIQQNNSTGVSTFERSGCLTLATTAGSQSFAISMGGCSTSVDSGTGTCMADSQGHTGLFTTGRLIEFDDSTGSGTRGSGIIRLQDNSAFAAGLSGFYAFGLRGWDSAHKRYVEAGSFTASSGVLSSLAADINDGGILQSALVNGAGSASAVNLTTGRATGALAVGTSSLNNLALYVISAAEVIMASTGTPSPANPFVSGEAIRANGPFGDASLQNSHMFHTAGLATSGPDPAIGTLQFDGISTFTGTQYEDQAGTIGTTSLSGNYTVDPNSGRLLFTAPSLNQNLGDHPFVGYVIPAPPTLVRQDCVRLASCVTAFLISTDSTAQAGELEFQTPSIAPPPPFSNLYIAGYYFYGTDEPLDALSAALVGSSNANPTGAKYAGIQSVSYPDSSYCQQPGCAVLVPNETLSVAGGYSVSSSGTGTVGGGNVSITNGSITFYIDESPINLHPSVTIVEQ